MILAQSRTHARADGLAQAIAAIQPSRVLGMAGAITLNIAALLLLLVPVAAPIQIAEPEGPVYTVPLDPPKPPPPPPIQQVERPKPHTAAPQPELRPQPATVPPPPVLTDIATEMSLPPPTNVGTEVAKIDVPPSTEPAISERLQYADAPAPSYPREALMAGAEGTVVLKVLVDVDGTSLSVDIERSSGNRRLDDAAKRQVLRKWKFRPAIRDGQAIQVYGLVPVSFSLSRQ
ncbi:MAG: energy transducer TonB [Lysobacteraceae bacterium]